MRKTAAVCVAKLHDINSQLVEDQGFLDLLKDLLSDSTPMVVANTVAALAEIGEVSPTGELVCDSLFGWRRPTLISFPFSCAATALTDLDTSTINKLLTALNECTEWGQVFILDSLSGYQVHTYREEWVQCI